MDPIVLRAGKPLSRGGKGGGGGGGGESGLIPIAQLFRPSQRNECLLFTKHA